MYMYTLHCITGMFYYTLGNIHPQLRSTLRAIQLLSVVNVTLIEKYGMDEVLRPFVEELKEFEKVWTYAEISAVLVYMHTMSSS